MRIPLLAIITVLGLGACERNDWPPSERRLTTSFDEKREAMEALEQAMAADGIQRMNSRILSGDQALLGAPSLAEDAIDKYRRLLYSADGELSVLRRPDRTEFEMLSVPVNASLYVYRYVHGAPDEELENCDASMRVEPCGRCAVRLDRDWQLEFDWFPQDLDVEARECR